jgi:hypothetical protein
VKQTGIRTLALATALLPLLVAACATRSATGAAVEKPAASVESASAPAAAPKPTIAEARHMQTLPPPTATEVAAGIQVVHVGSTASGGLVDARFKVLDPAKLQVLLGTPPSPPTLIVGDQPPLMAPHSSMKGARFSKDQVFFILYPNTRGLVQPGTQVTVAVGQSKLGPVTAQ